MIFTDDAFSFSRQPLYDRRPGLFFGLTRTSPAFAYIDPGTSSLILQAALGGLAAAAAAVGLYWRKIKTLMGEKPPSPTKPAGGDISASGDKTE